MFSLYRTLSLRYLSRRWFRALLVVASIMLGDMTARQGSLALQAAGTSPGYPAMFAAVQSASKVGKDVLDDEETAFNAVLMALEVFQQTPAEFYPYTSKYDAVLRGQAQLTVPGLPGLRLSSCSTSVKVLVTSGLASACGTWHWVQK